MVNKTKSLKHLLQSYTTTALDFFKLPHTQKVTNKLQNWCSKVSWLRHWKCLTMLYVSMG